MTVTSREGFTSKIGIIAAAAGSAIGLGNIWRFPYVTGQDGGAAFLLVYLLFVILIGVPVMLSEFVIGRRAQRNPYGAFKALAPGKPWFLIGIMGIVAAFTILAFYSTVAGWTLEYIRLSLINGFKNKSTEEINLIFTQFMQNGLQPVIWQLVFMFLTAFIVYRGIQKGIEKYTKILMPILFLIIVIICIRSVTLPGSGEGIKFLFRPDFSKLNANVILEALGQSFFSLSIGMGTLITYGSYISRKENLPQTAFTVSMADTLIAVLAGVAIFPAVFAFHIQPTEGPGLVFVTLPGIFQSMPGGYIWALMFFILLSIAALTSTISVLEVVVAFLSEEYKLTRRKATIISSLAISALGVICTLSQMEASVFKIAGKDIFGILEYLSANILLPLGGFFIVLFVGWFLGKKNVQEEITSGGLLKGSILPVYLFIIRVLAPIAIIFVFLNGLGLFD